MQDKIILAIDALASAAFIEGGVSPENTQAARDLTEQRKRELAQAISSPCLLQIQEPPTKTEALAHYSQQAILAMGEAGAAQHVSADVPTSGAVALTEYLKDCDQHSIVPDVGGAFAFAFAAGFNLATPQAAPAAVAVTALEKVLHAIQHYLPPDGVSARDTLTSIIEVVDPWPLSAKAAPGAEPLPLLVRDIARELGITCADACIALKPLGNFSVNSAVTAEMASKLRECFPEAAAVAVPDERDAFEIKFPMPADCVRCGTGYASTSYNGWRANDHVNRWEGWHARAALAATPAAAAPVVLPEPDGFLESHPFGSIYHRGKPSQMQMICGACPPMYEASTVRALLAGVSAPAAQTYMDSTPQLHVGDSSFEGWYAIYVKEGTVSLKQNCRDAYAAGMGDPLVVAAPQAQADARDADDAALVEWLSGHYLAADFHWGDPKTPVLVIEIPPTASVCGDFRTDVRSAIAAQTTQQTQGGE